MQICVTKKLADKMNLSKLPKLEQTDGFYTWRANITNCENLRLLVFMNDASHLFVGAYEIDDRSKPSSVFAELLARYGIPVKKTMACDFVIKLDLEGNKEKTETI